jgi:hypothetical protein
LESGAKATKGAVVTAGTAVVAVVVTIKKGAEKVADVVDAVLGDDEPSSTTPNETPDASSSSGTSQPSGGGQTGRKLNKDAPANGEQRVYDARQKYQDMKTKMNKTPADKLAEQKAKNEFQRAIDALKKSEQHAQTGQRPSKRN